MFSTGLNSGHFDEGEKGWMTISGPKRRGALPHGFGRKRGEADVNQVYENAPLSNLLLSFRSPQVE